MKFYLSLTTLLFISCNTGPRQGYITHTQLKDTLPQYSPFDTLSAYRKHPGSPKTRYVKAYYRKDSTLVKEHYRSAKGS